MNILEIKKKTAKKLNLASRENTLDAYDAKQAEITKLLKQIELALETHDKNASGSGGHKHEHVRDLSKVTKSLIEIRNFLNGKEG